MTVWERRIVSSAAWAAAETWGRQAIVFAIFVVLARQLGPDAFGLAALAMVVPTIFVVPVTQGIPEALIQRPEIEPIHLDSAFWLLAAGGSILSVLIWIFSGVVALALRDPLLEDLIRWTSIIVVIQSLSAVPTAILKRELNFRLLAMRTMLGTLVGGALGIGLAITGSGVWSLVGMQIAKVATETSLVFLFGAWRPRARFSYSRCRDLFAFSGPVVGQSLWMLVNEELPKVVVGTYLGTYAVGVYSFARRPFELLSQVLLSPLTNVAMPTVSRLQAEPAKIDRFFNATVRIATVTSFPAFIGFAAIAPEAVPLLFGLQWVSAVTAVQIFMLLGLLRCIDSLSALTILALGHAGLILKLHITYTVLTILTLPGAAKISLEALVAGIVGCNLALVPIFLLMTQRLAHVDVMQPLIILPRLLAAAVVMFASVTAWRLAAPPDTNPVLVIVVGVAVGAATYGTAGLLLMRPDLVKARDMLLRTRH